MNITPEFLNQHFSSTRYTVEGINSKISSLHERITVVKTTPNVPDVTEKVTRLAGELGELREIELVLKSDIYKRFLEQEKHSTFKDYYNSIILKTINNE